jgi:hypothetical protein
MTEVEGVLGASSEGVVTVPSSSVSASCAIAATARRWLFVIRRRTLRMGGVLGKRVNDPVRDFHSEYRGTTCFSTTLGTYSTLFA